MAKKTTQTSGRKYSIIALIVTVLACISTALLAGTKGVIALGLYTIASPEKLTNALWVSLGLVIIGIAVYAFLEPAKIQKFLTGRQAKYGGNTIIAVLAFALTVVIVNVLAFDNPYQVADLTEDKANTLSPEMATALGELPEKITATAFFSQNLSTETAEQLLGNIKAKSGGKFDYSFVDPNRDPQQALAAGITGDGKVQLKMGDRSEIAASASESEILEAMIRLINPEERTVYFLTGHGERDPEQVDQDNNTSFTRASDTLKSKNYTVKSLNLLAENKIPDDADLIIIAGPLKPLSANEVGLLQAYLNNGGGLLVMEDPTSLTSFGDTPDPLAKMLTTDWGITLNDDTVVDLASSDPTFAVSASYDSSHSITRKMNNLVTFFPFTRSLTVDSTKQTVQLTPLVSTTGQSWGETDPNSLTQAGWPPSYDPATETLGPMILVAAGENPANQGRVVVFGTSQFASDKAFDSGYGNSDMFVNSVDWAAGQENLTNITPKEPVTRLFQPASQLRILMLMLIVGLVIPGIFVALGIVTWLQRRRQG